MDSDSIPRLSHRLLSSPLAERGTVVISSLTFRENIQKLSAPLRGTLGDLLESVRKSVPTDFNFTAEFSLQGMRLHLGFEDGNTEGSAGELFFTSVRSVSRRLHRLPWDEMRASCIEEGLIFDKLLSEADDRPPNIPSSREAAEACMEALEEAAEQVRQRNPIPEFALIISRSDCGIEVEQLADRHRLLGAISDTMTTGYDILMILEHGIRWSFEEIEGAKREAVEGLGPISRAKAERRFLV